MSSIKDKVYNASQKIMRAVFHGAPNLFTAPDINRQLDIFDHRFNMLEGFLPATSDMTFSVANGEAKMTYSYLEVAGVQLYNGSSRTDTITDGFYDDDHLIGLYVKRKLVTYANDGADHLISGAVFVDGTSMAAADHYVISDYGFVVGTAQSGTVQWAFLPDDSEVVSVVWSHNVLLGAGLRSDVSATIQKGYPLMTKLVNTVVRLLQYQPSTVKYEIPTEQMGAYATGIGGVAYFYMDKNMLMVSVDAQVAFNNTSSDSKVLTASIPLSSVFSQTLWNVNDVLIAGGATTTNTGEAQNPFVVVCPTHFMQKPGNIAHTAYQTYVTIETQGETSLRTPTVKLCIRLAAQSVVGTYSCRFRGQLIVPNKGSRV
jgi:hypothetical protein